MGKFPFIISEFVIVIFRSVVQLSLIDKPNDSKAATVFTAGGRSVREQPSTFTSDKVPVIVGAVVSRILMVCFTIVEPQIVVILKVLSTVIGQLPLFESL